MKRFALLALAVISAFVLPATTKAQEYAPLIQKETVAVFRLNFDKLDAEQLSSQAITLGNSAVDYFVADTEKAAQLKEAVPLAQVFVAQYFATFVQPLKDANVSNMYFVLDQSDDPDETIYPYIAIATDSLSSDDLEKARSAMKLLNQQLNSALKYRFVHNGFFYTLLVPADKDADEVKAYVKERFTELNTVDKPEFKEGFDMADPDAVFTSVALSAKNKELVNTQLENAFAQIDAAGLEEFGDSIKAFVQQASDLSLKCADLVKFNVCDVNIDKFEVVSRAVAVSDAAAEEYVELVDGFIDETNDFLDSIFVQAIEMDESAEVDEEDVKAISESLKEILALFTKFDVDGSTITWKMDGDFWTKNKPVFDDFASTIAGLAEKAGVDVDELDDEDDLDFDELDLEDDE